ncbi:type VI secretion system baseplate subunit TssE [Vibrio sp. SM6]|uniref:Type VI secretion system baseplate subunit TssE n=1 Tax=Vibrio agarilyticus TaxID=2726741 RepID=A0A7X8TND6_9VIBR|nr:type VI secretion system baseplate subunit TssE [Vibrio agarilyticus]NLS11779.1 type VI secretion system baseplate subunit TssE [Vibrio agarilyticus]
MAFWNTFIRSRQSPNDADALLGAVHYQLTQLLNAEAPMREVSSAFPQAQGSLLCFGLESNQSVSSQIDQDQFSRALERLITAFEPRLSDVSVVVQESDGETNAILFSIMAKVDTPNGPHLFLFDSNLNLSTQQTTMEGQEIV